ncbi:hypothetical protein CHS0354_027160 [Potamilus streckersoni]|uniref:Uncharacterized protein n=1 Tax=Potamilus streckersoni TaxID=2493646 RepID=A0AAE0WFN1_9BIVA|nr:hypothetical protein CHS0354_027160 [Potamilus streckersoni]
MSVYVLFSAKKDFLITSLYRRLFSIDTMHLEHCMQNLFPGFRFIHSSMSEISRMQRQSERRTKIDSSVITAFNTSENLFLSQSIHKHSSPKGPCKDAYILIS